MLDNVLDLLIRKQTKDCSKGDSGSSSSQTTEATLSDMEINIVKYAAGYVAKSFK